MCWLIVVKVLRHHKLFNIIEIISSFCSCPLLFNISSQINIIDAHPIFAALRQLQNLHRQAFHQQYRLQLAEYQYDLLLSSPVFAFLFGRSKT